MSPRTSTPRVKANASDHLQMQSSLECSKANTGLGVSVQKGTSSTCPMQLIFRIHGIGYHILDFLLMGRDPITFGSLRDRLNFALVCKDLNRCLQERVRAASISRYVDVRGRWDKMEFRPRVILEHVDRLPVSGWLDSLQHIQSITLKHSNICQHDLTMIREAAPRLTSIAIENCCLELIDYKSHYSEVPEALHGDRDIPVKDMRCISFIKQIIQPLEGVANVLIQYPTITWFPPSESPRKLEKAYATSPVHVAQDASKFECLLAADHQLGSIPHWYTRMKSSREGMISGQDAWRRLEFVFYHSDADSLILHHTLGPVPAFLAPDLFTRIRIARPQSAQLMDTNNALWAGLRASSKSGIHVLVDVFGETDGQLYQWLNPTTGEYFVNVSDLDTLDLINRVLMSARGAMYTLYDLD